MMPDFVGNVFNLLNDALKWVLYIVPVAAGFVMAYHALMIKFTDGEHTANIKHKDAMKKTLIYGAIAFSASGIVSVILSYFR